MSSDFIKKIRQQQALGRISIVIDKEYFKDLAKDSNIALDWMF
jgi:hypothetical protein